MNYHQYLYITFHVSYKTSKRNKVILIIKNEIIFFKKTSIIIYSVINYKLYIISFSFYQ